MDVMQFAIMMKTIFHGRSVGGRRWRVNHDDRQFEIEFDTGGADEFNEFKVTLLKVHERQFGEELSSDVVRAVWLVNERRHPFFSATEVKLIILKALLGEQNSDTEHGN
jgi:hypothetical protein